jgi:hypothetical protein
VKSKYSDRANLVIMNKKIDLSNLFIVSIATPLFNRNVFTILMNTNYAKKNRGAITNSSNLVRGWAFKWS